MESVKRRSAEQEYLFGNHVTDNGLIFKELYNSTTKRHKTQLKNGHCPAMSWEVFLQRKYTGDQ
jgi:hypothetical protein